QKVYRQDVYTSERDSDPLDFSAWITNQEFEGNEVGARLVLQHTGWLQTHYRYTVVTGDSYVEDERSVGRAHSLDYDAHFATVGFVLTPSDRFVLSSMVSHQDIRTALPD